MLEKILNVIGYAKRPVPTKNVGPDNFALPVPIAPEGHLTDAGSFEWSKATPKFTNWGFGYSDGDTYHFALGKDGWAPLYVVCATFLFEPLDFIKEELNRGWFLDEHNPRLQSWHTANGVALAFFADQMGRGTSVTRADTDFTELLPSELGHMFEQLHLSAYPRTSGVELACSDAAAAFYDGPAMASLRKARGEAMGEFIKGALRWFQARGAEVDTVNNLVKVEGYQPLYLVEEQFL